MSAPMPYGPATPSIRRFLVQLAGLDAATHAAVTAKFASLSTSQAFAAADAALADTIERSGRSQERDALAGPLLQMTRRASGMLPADGTEQPHDLDPIAEPALAALLALLVADVIPPRHFAVLYSAFEDAIPRDALDR